VETERRQIACSRATARRPQLASQAFFYGGIVGATHQRLFFLQCVSQLDIFLTVELIYLDLNFRFNMDVIFMVNYSFCGMRRHINSEILLVTDFMNLKIKLSQSFGSAHMNKLYVCIFIGLSVCTCIKIYVYPVFIKKSFFFLFFSLEN
jgi:hypothetical protein